MKSKKNESQQQKKYDRGQVFVKVVAGILAVLMIIAVAASTIFAIFM